MNTKKLYIISLIWPILPMTRCYGLKSAMLRWAGAQVGKNVQIFSTAKIYGELDLYIGDNVWIGHDAMIMGPAGSKIVIEDDCKVGTRAMIVTGYHEYSARGSNVAGRGMKDDVVIKKGALLDTMSMVCPGKIVGEMTHVAAKALVTHDTPSYVRVAGIPARVVKDFKEEQSKD